MSVFVFICLSFTSTGKPYQHRTVRLRRNKWLDNLLDAIGLVGNLSWHVLTILALLGIILGLSRIKSFSSQLEDVVKTVEQLGKAALTKDGDPVLDVKILTDLRQQLETIRNEFAEYQKTANKHYIDIEHQSQQDKWIDCDITRCVHLQGIFSRIDRVVERLDQFDRRADDSRAQTTTSLQAISVAQKELGRELGELAKTIITVLGDIIRERDRR